MSTQSTRRSSFSSSTTSSLAKRHATVAASENSGKFAGASSMDKKRAPLSNITNQKNVSGRSVAPSNLVPCSNKIAKAKRAQPENVSKIAFSRDVLPASVNVKPSSALPQISALVRNVGINNTSSNINSFTRTHAPRSMDVSPSKSDGQSVSMDESMSTDSTSDSDSFQSPEIEYLDNNDVPAVDSIRRKTLSDLYISHHVETIGNICNRDVLAEDMEVDGKVVNIDNDYTDPQLCATFACDIYKHLRASEVKKRPSKFFMETVQKDINVNMRAILIDWLVEVAEEYRLVPDTLYLTVNYIDRYLSGNSMNRQRLQLLGVACMMIAAKYEEICAPQVEEFCYISDNTYFKDEVLEMESAVLNYLKFEMTTPTPKSFLKRFVRAAQGINEDPTLQLECLANYIAELSLIEYSMLCYAPSLIAASAIFLAKFMLLPSKRPWNSTLRYYTLYEPSDLLHCVNDLHRLCLNNKDSTLPAVREKYSLHKYKCVAKKYCPPSIHPEYFHNQMH